MAIFVFKFDLHTNDVRYELYIIAYYRIIIIILLLNVSGVLKVKAKYVPLL